ncbi:MAG: 50S ribosomal protein L11 methyltransferase [Filifactor alocis]|nr:50S ribosomal protein L11 methyltransferase [Filifactor alocis]
MKWIELKIQTHRMAVDAISEMLYPIGAKGFSIEDPLDLENFKEEFPYWDYIDEGIENREIDTVVIKAYFPQEDTKIEEVIPQLRMKIEELKNFGLEIGELDISKSEMEQEDWEDGWKQYFKTFHATDRIVIQPIWEEYRPREDEIIVKMDPGMAFGTGEHETTAMCLSLIEKYLKGGDDVLDVGCGSAILSIAAKKLGANKVDAIDLDPVAVRVAKENISYNELKGQIRVMEGNLVDKVDGRYDIVVANIMADVIILLTSSVKDFLKEGGSFIASGIINEKREEVIRALEENGFVLSDSLQRGEWNALVARRGE